MPCRNATRCLLRMGEVVESDFMVDSGSHRHRQNPPARGKQRTRYRPTDRHHILPGFDIPNTQIIQGGVHSHNAHSIRGDGEVNDPCRIRLEFNLMAGRREGREEDRGRGSPFAPRRQLVCRLVGEGRRANAGIEE